MFYKKKTENTMKRVLTAIIFLGLGYFGAFAQEENSTVRSGNSLYKAKKYEEAQVAYKKALDIKPESFRATFNLGDALFRQKKYDEAIKEFNIITTKEKDKTRLANVYYNMGNTHVMAGKLDEAIDMYKKSLRLNPGDKAAKYNLAYAQNMKKNGQNQQNQDEKNKDKNKDQQNKDQQNKDKQDKKDQQDQQNKQDANKDQQQDQKQGQDKKNKISKEDAQRMLEAMQNDEKKTQEKVREQQKMKARSVRIEKEW